MSDLEQHGPSYQAEEVAKKIKADKKSFKFLKTGIASLDYALDGGFLRKELVLFGAAPGTGKSTLAAELFFMIARQGIKSAYFSLEISNEMIVSRLIGGLANIKPIRVRMGDYTESEQIELLRAEGDFLNYEEWMTFYDEVYTIDEMLEETEKHGYEFIVIDYIQNIIGGAHDEYSRLSKAALMLQKSAKKLNCCMLVLSQLSNASVTKGSDKTQNLEYKGSGSIAAVCDLGFLLVKTEADLNFYSPQSSSITLKLRKNRRGDLSITDFKLMYQKPGGWITDGTIIGVREERGDQKEPYVIIKKENRVVVPFPSEDDRESLYEEFNEEIPL